MRQLFWTIIVAFLLPSAIPNPCSLENCDGTSLISAIKRDFEPWRLRGGIKRKGWRSFEVSDAILYLCLDNAFAFEDCDSLNSLF